MKLRNLLYPATLSIMAFMAIQCKNAEQDRPSPKLQGKQLTIIATLEQPVGTKTTLSSERKVLWSEGDQIKVYNSSNPEGVVFTLDAAYAGTGTGQFTGEALSGSGPYYALYPASIGDKLSRSSIPINLPSVQTYAAGSFGPGAAVSVAKGGSVENLIFKNVLGGVSFTFSNSHAISGIRLQTRGAEAITGTGKVNMSNDIPSLIMDAPSSDDQSYLMMTCPGDASTSFCFMLPPGAFDQGFIVEFLDKNGNVMFKSAKAEVNTVVRSSILSMPELSFKADFNAGFFTSESFGYYPSIGPSEVFDNSKEYTPGVCQYAYKTGDDRYVRVQSLSLGFCTEITTPKSMSLGETYEATVSMVDGSIKTSFTMDYTVLQKTGNKVWLVNDAEKMGIIQKLED